MNITLNLNLCHLPELREAVRARNMVVQTDTTTTTTERAVCSDLEKRVDLLAAAVDAEIAANQYRKQYNRYVWGSPQPNSRKSRKEAAKKAQETPRGQAQGNDIPRDEPPQEGPQDAQEAATVTIANRPM